MGATFEAVSFNTALTAEQFLELLLGPRNGTSAFADDTLRRVAWRRHSTELLQLVDPGSRPWGWWQYDAPEPPLPREPEINYLSRYRLLTSVERERLAVASL